jgi:hypothetical protein
MKPSPFALGLVACSCLVSAALGEALKPVPPGQYHELPANPFNLPAVPDFHGWDVLAFAQRVVLAGDASDPNAEAWADGQVRGRFDSIDGSWASRWMSTYGSDSGWVTGKAEIRSLGSRVFIRYDETRGLPGQPETLVEIEHPVRPTAYTALIEAVREGDRLIGRFYNHQDLADTSPWIGKIVDNYRIDGEWGVGRWDFRRGRSAAGGDGLQ